MNGADTRVWPVFQLDFNQSRGNGGVWTVISENEVLTWQPLVGREVIVEDYDEGEDLRFYGTVTALSPAKVPGRWVMDVQVGPEWRRADRTSTPRDDA